MKHFAIHSSRTNLKNALQELVAHLANIGIDASLLPKSVKYSLDYADEVDQKISDAGADWKKEFFEFFESDDFNELVNADECKRLFLTSLKGSSDITYPLLVELCAEYDVDIDDVFKKVNSDESKLTSNNYYLVSAASVFNLGEHETLSQAKNSYYFAAMLGHSPSTFICNRAQAYETLRQLKEKLAPYDNSMFKQ